MPISTVSLNRRDGTASLTYTLAGTERMLLYGANTITLPPIPAPITMDLDDFEWLVRETSNFFSLVQTHLAPIPQRDGVFDVQFGIGNQNQSGLWRCGFEVTFNNLNPPPGIPQMVGFEVKPQGTGAVEFGTRPEVVVIWPSFQLLNVLSREMIYCAHYGRRPYAHETMALTAGDVKRTWPVQP